MNSLTAGKLSKNAIARVINGTMFLGGCVLLGSGWLLDERMPHGRGTGGGRMTALGLSRQDWGSVHAWVGYGVAVLAAVHLALHWRWLMTIAAAQKPWRLALGLAAGLLVIGFFLFAPVTS